LTKQAGRCAAEKAKMDGWGGAFYKDAIPNGIQADRTEINRPGAQNF
jgi:hypothetical protein